MQKWIDLFLALIKQTPNNKVFSIMFLITVALSYTAYYNVQNYRRDIHDCRDRLDNNTRYYEEKIDAIHQENKAEYRELLQYYKDLSKETERLKKEI